MRYHQRVAINTPAIMPNIRYPNSSVIVSLNTIISNRPPVKICPLQTNITKWSIYVNTEITEI